MFVFDPCSLYSYFAGMANPVPTGIWAKAYNETGCPTQKIMQFAFISSRSIEIMNVDMLHDLLG